MTTIATPIKKEQSNGSSVENKKAIENNKQSAEHLREAAVHLIDAARHYEEANYEKATQSTIAAHGRLSLASETERGEIKHEKTVTHLKEAAKHLLEAARYQEEENYEKATQSTITAHGHLNIASEIQRVVAKQETLKN